MVLGVGKGFDVYFEGIREMQIIGFFFCYMFGFWDLSDIVFIYV